MTSGGALDNTSGTLAASGSSEVKAASLANGGRITAGGTLDATTTGLLDNSTGTLSAQTVTTHAGALKNDGGAISGDSVAVSAGSIENSRGKIAANSLSVTASELNNQGGMLTQLGTAATSINIGGALDNSNGGVIQTNGTDLRLTSTGLDNDGGTVTHAGTGTLTIDAGSGGLSNVGGHIVGNGGASVSAGTIDNTGGVLATQALLGATLRGGLDNANGRLSSGTAVSLTVGGALDNVGGVIGAGGAVADSALGILAASIDNSDGAITNAGTGQMWIDGSSQIVNRHAGGVAGMGSISGNGDTMVTATSVSNTQGGQLGGGNLHVHGANLDNSGGQIGNVANATGNVDVNMSGSIGNSGGTIGSAHDLALSAYAVGGGTYSAGGNLSLSQQADFAITTAYRFSTGRKLSFTLPGNFGNNISFVAANDLSINAGAIWNSGSIAVGGVLSTHGATLDNTGTLVGASVVITAGQSISNRGPSALIGATSGGGLLALMAPDIENRDDSTVGDSSATTAIYGLGQVILAGGQDANGNFYNAGVIRNQSGLIQSGRDMLIEANLVTNTRRAMGVSGLVPLDPAYVESLGISLAGRTGQANHPDPNSIGGVYIDPPHGGRDNSDYLYTDYTGIASGSVVNYVTPKSQIVSGGNLNAYSVGTLQNYWSQVAAVGNIGSPQSIDQNSWRGQTAPQIVVTYSGVYTYRTYKGRMWGYDFCDGNAICKAPVDVRTYAMPASGAYESTFTAGGTLSGTGVTINNTAGNAGLLPPPALQAGQTAQSDRAQSVGGTLGGGQGGSAVATGAVSGAVDSATVVRSIGASAIHDTIDAGATGHDLSVRAVGGAVQTGAASQAIGAGAMSGSVAARTGRQAIEAGTVSGSLGGGASGQTVAVGTVSGSIAGGGGGVASGAAAASGTIGSDTGGVQVGATAASGTIAAGGGRDITAGAVSGTIAAGGAAPQVAAGGVSGSVAAGSSGVQVGASAASGTVAGGLPAARVSTQGGHIASGGVGAVGRTNVANATAPAVLSHIALPAGGLFSVVTAPQTPYLIETNPAFTSAQQWLSSDYYFQQTGMDPSKIQLRLGDGFYEQKLVQDQIMAMTGKAVLTNYADTQAEYQALMTSGAALAKALDLAPGTGLSPEQVAQLTSNVVIMQTQVVDGKSVLVPVVYLAQASQQDMRNGPLIAATNIDLQNAVAVNNSGTISASNDFSISSQRIDSSFGTLQSGGNMSLVSSGDVNLTSATVNAGSLQLKAGGNLVLDSAVNTLNQSGNGGATRTTTSLGPLASINVSGNASIVTGGNFEQNAGSLNVGGALGLNVGGDWTLGVQQTGESQLVYRHGGVSDTRFSIDTGSSVKVGGASAIVVGGNLSATGANLNLGGGGAIEVGGNLNLQAAVATSTIDSSSSGSESHRSYAEARHVSDDAVIATTLTGGDSLTLAAGKDINVLGSTVSLDRGAAQLVAGGNVTIGAVTETHVNDSHETHSHSGLASSTKVASSRDTTTTLADGSTISADSVSIVGGQDLNVRGSTIVGTHDVSLTAAHDVNITTTQDTMDSSGSYQEKHSGLMAGGGLSVSVGTSKLATTDQDASVTNNASTIGSLSGNLTIRAGDTLHVTGSDLIAAKNLTGIASTVTIDAATDTSHQSQTQQTSKSGLTVGLSGTVGDAINGAIGETQATRESAKDSNGRAAALHAIAAAGDLAFGGMGVKGLLDGATGPQAPSIGVQVSVGSSHSSMQSSEDQTIQRGSSINAGGDAKLIATGNGTPKDGDITIAGSNVNAANVALVANNQVNLVNTTDTDKTQSSNSSSGSSVGVSVGTNGIGVSASMQRAHGDGNSDAAIQNNTHINASQTATIVSGGDTNVTGANVNANKVVADVGGSLNVASVQDTTVSAAHQSSAGGGVTISQAGGVGGSFSAQNGHADGNYAGVNEQAGIQAGSGGFDVTVKGNTDLKGAYIGSTADPSNNSLTTGTLTTSDIENHSHYSANSAGFSAGASVGVSTKAVGPSSVSGSGGVTPMVFQNDSGDQSATTKSAVSAGTINITKPGEQTQDLANLNRDATNLNGTVSKTPDVQKTLSQQADTMNAAQAAGQTVSQGIGLYADNKRDAALKAAHAAYDSGDLAGAQAALNEAKGWMEGGASRAELQMGGGALIGGLGGGSALTAIGGAAGAGMSSLLAGQAEKISKSVVDTTGSSLVGNIAANVAATVGGALVGGSAGAAMASNVQLYNAGNDTNNKDAQAKATGLQGLINQAVAAGVGELNAVANARNAIGNAIGNAVDSAASQFGTLMKRDAQDKISQSPAQLISQGVANGVNTVLGSKGGEPPMAGPSVALVDSVTGQAANATLGATDRTPPSNAILSNSNSDNNSTQGSQSGTVTKTPNPDATGSLSGKPTQIPPLSDEATTRSLIRENQSAVTLANKGYDVVQNPEVPGPKNPDYTINGQVFDNYAPATGNVRNIATTISNKVSSGQASNIVVNLADSSTSPAEIEAQINSYPIPGLGKVIVIDKLGNITIIKPKGN
ncbi:hemagglutinin repeat-containing protein [Burkholderia glumae]|uniref:hemagglutinin repeat-containing protein n=1 Tax=Burkholderia glumae TaxID=337 RepID=UPI0035D59AF4